MDNVEFEKRVLQNESLCKEGKLIVKPAKDTGGGLGVRLFTYNANDYKWVSNEGETLTLDYLEKKYKRNPRHTDRRDALCLPPGTAPPRSFTRSISPIPTPSTASAARNWHRNWTIL